MKNLSLVLNIVLLVAVGVLYFLHFSGSSPMEMTEEDSVDSTAIAENVTIAYVHTDSLLNNYKYFQDLSDKFEGKRSRLERELQGQAQVFQREVQTFQQTAGSMTMNQARAKQEELQQREQNLLMRREQLQSQLMQENAKSQNELYDKIAAYLSDYGKDKKLKMVLFYSKGSNILYADDALDITNEVIKGLNEEYRIEQSGGDDKKKTSAADTTASE